MTDLILTAEGMPALVVGQERYPLCFAVAGMKEWAEFEGKSIKEALEGGWQADELTDEQSAKLLLVALKGGEARRQLFSPGPPHEISDEFVAALMDGLLPVEVWALLLGAWNAPGGRPNPQVPTPAASDGEPFSE